MSATASRRRSASYTAGEEKWSGGGAEDPAKDATVVLTRLAGPGSPIVRNPGYIIVGAWIREAAGLGEGPLFASYPASDRIRYDWTGWSTADPQVEGEVAGNKVTIYTGDLGKPPKGKPLRAYVALMRNPQAPKPGGGGNLGIVLAILGPLLVGGLAYAIASGAHEERPLPGPRDRPPRLVRRRDAHAARAGRRRGDGRARGGADGRPTWSSASKHGDADLDEIAEQGAARSPRRSTARSSARTRRGCRTTRSRRCSSRASRSPATTSSTSPSTSTTWASSCSTRTSAALPAALVMASARSYVRADAPGELSPAAVLKTVNRHLAGDLPAGRHVTALYVVLNTREGKATIASAGHLPLIVYRHAGGKMAKVNPEGIALGLDHGPVFERALQEGDIPIGLGDRIVLYTDGALNIQQRVRRGVRRVSASTSRGPRGAEELAGLRQLRRGAPSTSSTSSVHAERRHHDLDVKRLK